MHVVENKLQLVLREIGGGRGKEKNVQITTFVRKREGKRAYYCRWLRLNRKRRRGRANHS